MEDLIGTTIGGRWVVDERVGEGSMGVVYRVHHDIIGKPMALKLLHTSLANNDELTARFLREAQTASTISSPHVVDIVDFGHGEASAYLVMEYVPGTNLAALMRNGPVPLGLIYELAIDIATGLRDAHAAQVIHRDVKPDNIAIIPREDGAFSCKLLDFGIAKGADSLCAGRLTAPGTVIGTPHYMAPEQATGGDLDARCDIYALGIILYEMVTGFVPFNSQILQDVIHGHLFRTPTPITALAPHCPASLAALIDRCIAKKPGERFATAAHLREALFDARDQYASSTDHSESLVPTVRPVAPTPANIQVASRWRHVQHAIIGTTIGAASTLAVYLATPTRGENDNARAPSARVAAGQDVQDAPHRFAPASLDGSLRSALSVRPPRAANVRHAVARAIAAAERHHEGSPRARRSGSTATSSDAALPASSAGRSGVVARPENVVDIVDPWRR